MPFVYHIDAIDKAILQELVTNAKIPYTELGNKLNISHGTVHQRIKKLENRGIIKKSSIIIDYEKLGFKFIMFLGIIANQGSNIDSICDTLSKIPHITVAHITSGQHNITCKIRAEDSNHASQIIQEINKIKGVLRTESTVSFKEFKNTKDFLIQEILANK